MLETEFGDAVDFATAWAGAATAQLSENLQEKREESRPRT